MSSSSSPWWRERLNEASWVSLCRPTDPQRNEMRKKEGNNRQRWANERRRTCNFSRCCITRHCLTLPFHSIAFVLFIIREGDWSKEEEIVARWRCVCARDRHATHLNPTAFQSYFIFLSFHFILFWNIIIFCFKEEEENFNIFISDSCVALLRLDWWFYCVLHIFQRILSSR